MRNLVALVVTMLIVSAAPAVEAQSRRPPEGWTALALRNAQNVPTALFATMDQSLCENAMVHGNYNSESCALLERRYASGQIDRLYSDAARSDYYSGNRSRGRWGTGSYGYDRGGYGSGYYGTPPINGNAGFRSGYGGYSQQYGYPTYGSYGIGPYDDFNGYGSGYLDYYGGDWTYHTRRGRHSLATQNNVNAWGVVNTALNAGNLVYNIVQTRKQNRRLDDINSALAELEHQRSMPVQVPVAQMAQVVRMPAEAPQQQAGAAVINQTGCDLLLKETSGRLTRLPANASTFVIEPNGLGGKTIDGKTCNITQERTADGGAVVLSCQ